MKLKAIDILNKIIALKQKFDEMPQPVPAEPIVLTTTDNVQVSVNKLEVGGMATINGTPAPANTYTFTDGSSITCDATGLITAVTPVPAPAPAPTPQPTQQQQQPAPAPAPAPQPTQMKATKFSFTDEHKTAEGAEKLFAQFATGTPEERIANLETVCKALMEYSFGWEIRQAKEKQERDAAIKVYTDTLAPLQQQMESQKKTIENQNELITGMVTLIQEFANESIAEPPHKTKTSFSVIPKAKKGIERFAAAAIKLQEEKLAEAKK